MKKEKELVKNTFIIFIGKIGTQIISFLMLPLYTAYLYTEEYGVVDLILTYVQLLVPVICIGLERGVFRFLIDYRKDKENSKKVITNSLLIIILSCIIFTALYVFLNLFIEIKFAELIILTILSAVFSNWLLQISRGFGNNIVYTIASAISGILTVILNVLCIVVLRLGAKGMILGMTISHFVTGLYIFIKLKVYEYINISVLDKKCIKELVKYSLPLVPSGISWWIVSISDRTIISMFLGIAANGIYAVANKFSSIINILTNVFTLSWTESASMYIDSKERDLFFSNIVNKSIRIFSCLCIGMVACMPIVFNIFVDSKYSDAYNYIPILVIASFFNVMVSIYSAIYVAKKLTKQVAYTSGVAAFINIFINIIFVKIIGLYAASISTVIAYFIMMLYRHIDLKKYVKLNIDYKIIICLIIFLIETTYIYYLKNMSISFLNLIVIVYLSIYINRELLKGILLEIKNKLFKKVEYEK